MKENEHIEELLSEPTLVEVMNHPERYSEEELRDFFAGPEQAEDARYVLLARMAKNRRHTAAPDAEQAWAAFRMQREEEASKSRRGGTWRMWVAALAGAAAMLAGVLLYNHFRQVGAEPDVASTVVALAFDNTPQRIMLQSDEQLVNLSEHDSLSYRRIAAAANQPIASAPVTIPRPEPKMQKLSTPRGMDFKVILPDGSEVWLNAESTIEFPATFLGNERHVVLRGEAYFKVARNEACPFIVTSDQMKVRVLGTEFNFKSYTSETSHISLVNGSVEVLQPDADTPVAILKPGEDAWRDEEGDIRVRPIDTYGVTQWVNGFFYFDDMPLVEVLRELGRWYNLGVVFRNTTHMHYKMHFSASRNDSVEQALDNLNRLRKVRVAIEGTDMVVY